jgi:hypothetical protein
MKKVFLTFLLLTALPVMATHIVGGEFELVHISGNTYKLNLILYFDKLNGDPGAKDASVTATIFRKSDDFRMAEYTLPFISESDVQYAQPLCSDGSIQTSKLIYSGNITLSETVYTDPSGYYISWQRCCRNYSILNIYSPQPPRAPEPPTSNRTKYAGQTFYLEFPPVVMDGEPFINSSPRLFPPLSDYACPFRPYYVDFGGIDDDKDSLVYSMVTPLTTKTSAALPAPSPRPYPEVLWFPSFSVNNILNGSPDLRISKDGLLTCTPSGTQGLYVFAVRVEEFRKGKKIGESRRDFQLYVVDKCPIASPPSIKEKKSNSTGSMTVSFDNTIINENRCIEVTVSDIDSTKPDQGLTENIGIRVVGLNFKNPKLNEILPSITTAVLKDGNAADFKICFPQCPYTNGSYQIGVIAFDDACSLPLTDTIKITVNVQPPPNNSPEITSDPSPPPVSEGDSPILLNFRATDVDQDSLVVSIVTDGFALPAFGMEVRITKNVKGIMEGYLFWDPHCNNDFDFTKRKNFTVKVLVNDQDLCDLNDPVAAVFKLNILLHGPTIYTDLTLDPNERIVIQNRKIFESLNFKVTGQDLLSSDSLVVTGKGVGFNASDYSVNFSGGKNKYKVSTDFKWKIGCDKIDLKKKDTYIFQFVVIGDKNKCRSDTVDVAVKLFPPDNAKPQLDALSQSSKNSTNSNLYFTLGQPIEINLLGTDTDFSPKDNLTLSLISATGNVQPQGYTFQKVTGISPVQSALSWNPDCSIFKDQTYENNYSFEFSVADDRCLNTKADTIKVNIKIKDVDGTGKEFYMPNVFTPNGDMRNDFFALEGIEGEEEGVAFDSKISLPKDNCTGRFELVQIFNRWGETVFESTDRKFRWYAPNQAAGVYYYRLKYSNREYKSPLSVTY